MEVYSAVELDDYWNEISSHQPHIHDEDSRSHDDDGESDETFLEELGLPVKDEVELSEAQKSLTRVFVNTLTPRQEEALKRRVQTYKNSYKKKRQKAKNQKPDIRNFFSSTDASSTGTRSRSATPDSLDSVSPPHTPPDPHHPRDWADLSRSRGSLDSGNHSLVTSSINTGSQQAISRDPFPSDKPRHSSVQSDNDRLCYDPPLPSGRWPGLPRSPSLEELSSSSIPPPQTRPPTKEVSIRRQRSYARDIARDVKQYYSNKGIYNINNATFESHPEDIQVLRYEHIGSIHIPHTRSRDHRPSLDTNSSNENIDNRRQRSVSNSSHLSSKEIDETPEIRPRSSSTTDLGFKVVGGKLGDDFPDLMLEIGRGGQTRVDWLDLSDIEKLNSLALLELDILFNEYSIQHRWRKFKKKKNKNYDSNVFGVPLSTLVERDHNNLPESCGEANTPQVILKLISHLDRHGIREEGILRVPGNRSKIDQLKQYLDHHYYSCPTECDAVLRSAAPNDLAALIKTFLRELPQPILTHSYSQAFYKTMKINDLGERVIALTMLILLLPPSHRDTLSAILSLCGRIIRLEPHNRMGLYNVAMIIAPNLFHPAIPRNKLHLRTEDKEHQLNQEMEYATVTTHLTQTLIKYRDILWTVPHRLLAQVRKQHDLQATRVTNNKPIYRLLNRKTKESIQRPIVNEVDYQEGVLRVSAAQFHKENYPVKLDSIMTAGDVLSRFIEEQTNYHEGPPRVEGRREMKKFSTGAIMTTCLLRGSFKHALDNHALHECGGNISDRKLDPRAKLLAVYQDNPNAEFIVKCHHPGGQLPRLGGQIPP